MSHEQTSPVTAHLSICLEDILQLLLIDCGRQAANKDGPHLPAATQPESGQQTQASILAWCTLLHTAYAWECVDEAGMSSAGY